MNIQGIILPFLVSFSVSIIFWFLVMVIPSLFPREVARLVSYFRMGPEDLLEIATILSHLEDHGWQKFFAMELLTDSAGSSPCESRGDERRNI